MVLGGLFRRLGYALIVCFSAPLWCADGEVTVEELVPGVLLHSSEEYTPSFGRVSSNGLVLVRGNAAYMVDTPWSLEDTAALIAWIENAGYLLKGVLVTHSHEDRSGGLALVNSLDIPTYASKLSNALLAKDGRAQAQFDFVDASFWWLSDAVEVFYPGAGHTSDNHVVWLPDQRVLYGGCLVRSAASKSLGFVGEADLSAWPQTIKELTKRFSNVAVVVPGHGAVGGPELLSHTLLLAEQGALRENDR